MEISSKVSRDQQRGILLNTFPNVTVSKKQYHTTATIALSLLVTQI